MWMWKYTNKRIKYGKFPYKFTESFFTLIWGTELSNVIDIKAKWKERLSQVFSKKKKEKFGNKNITNSDSIKLIIKGKKKFSRK